MIETMKIEAKNSDGYIIINKSDLTKEQKEFKPVVKRSPRKMAAVKVK